MLRYLPLLFCLVACVPKGGKSPFPLEVLDKRLVLDLVAEDPTIVTPIGLTIDSHDALYVLESHTHIPPADYSGPRFDQVKKGIDENGDGIPERWVVFAESIEDGMNICLDEEDKLYVVEKNRVQCFTDVDGDHRAEGVEILLEMVQPENVYDHAGLLGITYGPDDWLYVSRGNTGSQAWRLEGRDGSFVEGYGDGGNIMRCRADGTQLEEIATGFWNPFDLKFSHDGRLLSVDNDPDSRGPNRLVEIVPGGDFGYKSLYGGSGIHPFLAWNGELPETLPIAAAVGEAPSGLIDASFTQFPSIYQGAILATIWEENSIVSIPLSPFHSSVWGEAQVIIQGDSTFHPVALASNSKGELFLTDWVKRQYPNHGKGRVWRIRSKEVGYTGKAPPNVLSIHRFDSLQSLAAIRSSLQSEDPFLQTVARKQLRLKASSSLFSEWVAEPDSVLQLQTLLAALPVDGIGDSRQLESLLASPYQSVRMATLRFIAHNRRVDLLPALKKVLYQVPIDAEFLDSYLACIRHIQADFIEGYTKQEDRYSRKLVRELPIGFLQNLLKDSKLPVEVRSALVPFIQQDTLDLHIWSALIVASPPNVQQALIKSVEKRSDTFIGDTLLELLRDSNSSDLVKKQILVSLAYQPKNYSKDITDWIGSANFELLPLALKYLARYKQSANEQEEIKKIVNESTDSQLKTLWEFYKGQTAGGQEEKTRAEWLSWTQQAGNPERGKWIFQDPSAQCQLCHQVNGWGGAFGPDLSHVGSSKPQEELLSAILEPSKKMSPEWQGWFVKTLEGKTFTGRQIDVGEKYVELLMANGEFQSFKKPVQFGLLNTSLMPEGLEKRMLPEEFRDLIAYLLSLK